MAADDFSIRVSAAADGPEAVPSLLSFAGLAVRPDPEQLRDRRASFLEPAYGSRSLADVLPAVSRRPRRRALRSERADASACRRHRRTSSSWSTGSAPTCSRPTPMPRRTSPRCSRPRRTATAGVPVDDRDQPDLARHRADARRPRRRRVHLAGARLRPAAQRAVLGQGRRPASQWQPHPTAFQTLAAAGVHVTTVNKREFRGLRAHRRRSSRRRVDRRRPGRRAGRRRRHRGRRDARRSPTSTTATSTGPATATASPRPSGSSSWR